MINFLSCECGSIVCTKYIRVTRDALIDFAEYVDQRDKYYLISKSCKRASEILPEKIAVEGEDYYIIQEEA